MIQFENVKKTYGKQTVLKDLNFTIEDGQFVVLIGKSGCGKTTTLKAINQLIPTDSGKILIDGEDVSKKDKAELRRHIGYVIQQIGLFPNMTVAQNISVVPKLLKYDKESCDQIVTDMLKMVGMEEYRDKYPSEMSGGQQQRIGVLRALAASPPIVLMDEPFGALDPMTRDGLQNELKDLQKKLDKTIVFVTHDMNEALKMADVIIFMDKGEIIQMDSPEGFLENPANDLVKEFLGEHLYGAQVLTKVEDYMKKKVSTVKPHNGIHECAEMMARNSVDSLLVVDNDNKYLGTVEIGDFMHWGKGLKNIEPLIRQNERTVRIGEEAKESFDYLLETKANYVVVLDDEDHLMGIITKSSVAQNVATNLWGGDLS